MRQVLMSDIRKRMQNLTAPTSSFREQHNLDWRGMKSMRTADLKRMIETKITSCNDVNLYQILDMYQAFSEKANVSEISKVGLFIANEGIGKVRDAKHTQTLLKRRLTVAQHKLQPHIITPPAQPHPVADKPQAPIPQPATPQDQEKDQAMVEAYTKMLEAAIIYANCDRVIENYNRVSKRFNLEVLINENTRVNGVSDTVVELCNRIDTYQMPTAVKFNTVIETACYGFESNNIDYKKSELLETAIDYFLFKPDGRESCKEILEATLFFDKNEDMGNIDILMEDEPEQTEEPIDQLLQRHYGDNNISIPVKESKEFEDIFNKFKEEELAKTDKPENKLKGLITKLYSNNVTNIIEETPNLLKWLRSFFIVGSVAIPFIGPVVAAIGFIADKFISLHVERKEVAKMIKCFEHEIKATEKKIGSTNDKDEKEKLEKYKDALEKALVKLDMYHSELLTDEEQDQMYDNIGSDDDLDTSDIDINGLDDDLLDDFDFGEFNEFADICKATTKIGSVLEDVLRAYNSNPITEDMIFSIMENADNDAMLDLAYLGAKYPQDFHKDIMKISLESVLSNIRKNKITLESAVARSVRISSIHSALNILEQIRPDDESSAMTVFQGKMEMDSICEAIQGIQLLSTVNANETSPLMEASISNTLKLASMKLRKAMTGLKDKDRQMSQTIDLSVNNMKKGVEDALTNDNREAIIKGRILPSASKVIKMAIVNAGLSFFIHPAIAVIGTLGYLGVSAKFKSKERQMVIDEIEIEMKMCDKYIQIAEQKNDMKALKQLLMTKRNLERQLQRIKYKMKVDLGQKYYDAPKDQD